MASYEEVLGEIAASNPEVIVMTAENRAAIRGLPERLGGRFIDVGIAEQTMIGAAAGLALRGRVPVVHALAAFLTMRAFEFIRTDVGIPGLPVKLVGGVPGFLSEANGPTHQALEDIALMRQIPGMQVFCPSDAEDLVLGLPAILQSRAPAYIRFTARRSAVGHHSPFFVGRAETLGEGTDVAILTHGLLVEQAVGAKRILDEQGVSTTVVNLRTLQPIDAERVLELSANHSLVVTLEDHFQTGGLYSIVAELLVSRRSSAHVMPIALSGRWFRPGLLADVLAHEEFTAEAVAGRIRRQTG